MAHSKTILIGEDDQLLLKILGTRFEQEGYIVELATNGQEVLDKLDSSRHCALLLDLLMPVKNGFEVLKELKKKKNQVPVVVFSNLPEESSHQKVIELGAADFYQKSDIQVSDLVQAVKRFDC